jgi:hypothetical protein
MRRFVVNDDAAVPIGVVMRIEAVRHPQGDNCHQEGSSNGARVPADSSQHRHITIGLRGSRVKHPEG